MKYEEIKIGDVFRYEDYEETVISKSDEYKIITTIDGNMRTTTWKIADLYLLKPLKTTLDQVTDAVKDIADFTIEQNKSGVIILRPIT